MKSTLMAVAFATLTTVGVSAYANDYSVNHPYFMPNAGEFVLDSYYHQQTLKYNDSALKHGLDGGKSKLKYFQEDLFYAINDKWVVNLSYGRDSQKWKGDANGGFDNTYKGTDVTVAAIYKFYDDDSLFGKFSLGYYQDSGDSIYDGQDKGLDLHLTTGVKGKWADPYFDIRYYNTINRGGDNDGAVNMMLAAYKQICGKLGVNLGLKYYKDFSSYDEKLWSGRADFRYAFDKHQGLTLGCVWQLSDSAPQHSFDSEIGEVVSYKTKSRQTWFVDYIFRF